MSLAERLWLENADLARACLRHPFIRGIADGSLSQRNFAWYVGQDYFYLHAFTRAYCIAAAKGVDWDATKAFHALAAGAIEEADFHKGYASRWEVDLNEVKPSAATRRYTDFLLATAWGHDAGVTAAALTPCMRLYAHLGQAVAKERNHEGNPYAGWITTYSSQDFEALSRQLESLVDRYATPSKPVQDAYCYAMLCEHDFFDAAWRCKSGD
ncbi:MAG TPA: TenA family protein [Synergistaceae bacterium]|nr:TenA family protein [Synergistaceae bacterium]